MLRKQEEHEDGLKKGVAEFYDGMSEFWENILGEHIHLGYYELSSQKTAVSADAATTTAAQIRAIEEALLFAAVPEDPIKKPKQIIDVGCGLGGSSRYLAKKYGAQCHGITLSPVQVQRAQALTAQQGLEDRVSYGVADAMNQPFGDGQFDLVWSVESTEYMPDKIKFMSEMARVTAPGGRIVIVTFCHRNLAASEQSLRPDEIKTINKIEDTFHLRLRSAADYVKLLETHSLQDVKAVDWSPFTAPFWGVMLKSALTWKAIPLLLRSGWETVKQAIALPMIYKAIQTGLIQYAVICAHKKPLY